MPLLKVEGLRTYFYADDTTVKAVDGVTFDINEGETVALVGESGCGKSVSSLSVMQLVPGPTGRVVDGTVMFEGQDLLQLEQEEMRKIRGRRIAMIFQEPMTSLNPVMSIGTQLTEAISLHLGLTQKQAGSRSIGLLEKVGITDPERRIAQFPHEFSGGMRQRVMVAMALSCEPRLIIADEPTTALDVTIQAQVLDLLQDLTREQGTALLLITHNLGVVARYARRINVMYAGRIIESGLARDLFRTPSHPYTIGLLGSLPRLDRPRGSKLTAIPGQPPDLARLSDGCHFEPRCRFAIDRCAVDYPAEQDIGAGHKSACWVAAELASGSAVSR